MRLHKVGDIEVIKYKWVWHDCQVCGMPAQHRIAYLLPNYRSNPASSAYLHDDCSWCSDAEAWACSKHRREVERNAPDSMSWCSSFQLTNFQHMGWYKVKMA